MFKTYKLKKGDNNDRVHFVVPKKCIKKACMRNKIKRRFRAIMKDNNEILKKQKGKVIIYQYSKDILTDFTLFKENLINFLSSRS